MNPDIGLMGFSMYCCSALEEDSEHHKEIMQNILSYLRGNYDFITIANII